VEEEGEKGCSMKVYSLALLKYEETEPVFLGFASELSSFGYFQRSSVREMLYFISRTLTKRTLPGQRQSIEHQGPSPLKSSSTGEKDLYAYAYDLLRVLMWLHHLSMQRSTSVT
jgi:hypothetical protein